jgi:2-polyprenyl-3-methyl-5-hydroxy-6-metoxy-1,4-benzoquinol methylase
VSRIVDPHEHEEHAPDQHAYALPYHWCMSPFYKYVVEQMVSRAAPVLAGRKVLEAGCGDGFTTALIARRARSVHAFDISERAIAFAELIVRDPNVTFEMGDAVDVDRIAERAGGDLDVVAAFEMIEHLSSEGRNRFLEGCRRVLAHRGGALVLSTPNGERSGRRNPHHAHEFGLEELRSMLVQAGYADPRISGVYLQPPWERLEHFANTVPFRAGFRALARSGASVPGRSRTLLCVARPR